MVLSLEVPTKTWGDKLSQTTWNEERKRTSEAGSTDFPVEILMEIGVRLRGNEDEQSLR